MLTLSAAFYVVTMFIYQELKAEADTETLKMN